MSPSPRVSVCRSGRQHGGQGSCQRPAREGLWSQVGSRADKVLSPAGQGLWRVVTREITVAWSSSLGCGALLSQWWSGACLSYTWKVVCSTHLGLFSKCLGTLMPGVESAQGPVGATWQFCLAPLLASGEFPQEPLCGWSRSADRAALITCADILGESPCQMYLL